MNWGLPLNVLLWVRVEMRSERLSALGFRALDDFSSRVCRRWFVRFSRARELALVTLTDAPPAGVDQAAGLGMPARSNAAAIFPCWLMDMARSGSFPPSLSRMISKCMSRVRGSLPSFVNVLVVVRVAVAGNAGRLGEFTRAGDARCSKENPRKNRYTPISAPHTERMVRALAPDRWNGRKEFKVVRPETGARCAHRCLTGA